MTMKQFNLMATSVHPTDDEISFLNAPEWPVTKVVRQHQLVGADKVHSVVHFLIDQESSHADADKPSRDSNEESLAVSQIDVSHYMDSQKRQMHDLIRKVQLMREQEPRAGEFRWTAELHTQFVLVCLAFGVRKVTPKQIQQAMELDASRESIGSHLQKFRMKLAKQHCLSSSSLLENTHFPTDFEHDRVSELSKLWHSTGFQGLSLMDVQQLIRQ